MVDWAPAPAFAKPRKLSERFHGELEVGASETGGLYIVHYICNIVYLYNIVCYRLYIVYYILYM